jgi:hypothetical protein
MMKKYNMEKAIVFNTYQASIGSRTLMLNFLLQCYLKEAHRNLEDDLKKPAGTANI